MRYPETEVILIVGTMELTIEAWLDTGFEGGVTIPASMRDDILADAVNTRVRLADRHVVRVPTWVGAVEIAGHSFPCEIVALGNQVLLGLEVLNQMDVVFARGKRLRFNLSDGSEFVQKYDN
jgi:predicted aspartyl protease